MPMTHPLLILVAIILLVFVLELVLHAFESGAMNGVKPFIKNKGSDLFLAAAKVSWNAISFELPWDRIRRLRAIAQAEYARGLVSDGRGLIEDNFSVPVDSPERSTLFEGIITNRKQLHGCDLICIWDRHRRRLQWLNATLNQTVIALSAEHFKNSSRLNSATDVVVAPANVRRVNAW